MSPRKSVALHTAMQGSCMVPSKDRVMCCTFLYSTARRAARCDVQSVASHQHGQPRPASAADELLVTRHGPCGRALTNSDPSTTEISTPSTKDMGDPSDFSALWQCSDGEFRRAAKTIDKMRLHSYCMGAARVPRRPPVSSAAWHRALPSGARSGWRPAWACGFAFSPHHSGGGDARRNNMNKRRRAPCGVRPGSRGAISRRGAGQGGFSGAAGEGSA